MSPQLRAYLVITKENLHKICEYNMDIKAPFIWRKRVAVKSVTRLPELLYASQLFLGSKAGRVTYFDGRVTLLAGPTLLLIDTLVRPARSRQDNQSMGERYCRLFARAKG